MVKLGPLAKRDSCTDSEGLGDKLMTHFFLV